MPGRLSPALKTNPEGWQAARIAGQVAGRLREAYPHFLIRILQASMGPLEVMLFAGLAIPPGWADGFTHSRASKFECAKLIEKLPAYARGATKCIVKIDPNAKKPGA